MQKLEPMPVRGLFRPPGPCLPWCPPDLLLPASSLAQVGFLSVPLSSVVGEAFATKVTTDGKTRQAGRGPSGFGVACSRRGRWGGGGDRKTSTEAFVPSNPALHQWRAAQAQYVAGGVGDVRDQRARTWSAEGDGSGRARARHHRHGPKLPHAAWPRLD